MHFGKDQTELLNMLDEIEDYAILFLDKEGNIVDWNKGAENIKGYSSAEVIGRNFRIFYTEEDLLNGKPESLLQAAIKLGKASDEGWRVKKDGHRFWGSILIKAMYDENKNVLGFSKVTRDLTEKMRKDRAIRNYARELAAYNKQLEQFVYIASHDLQEPLLTVTNFIDLLEEEYSGNLDKDGLLYLSYISQSAERMKDLIKGLLDYSRIGVSRISTVDCEILVEQVKNDLHSSIQKSGANIYFHNLPVVNGNETQIRQLFQNLISNAIKFRKPGSIPEIEISAERQEQGWKFLVRDNGIGIDERYKEKIFVIFQRLNHRSEYEGNGIGLAHCKKIVELHDGEIYVESILQQGSTFCFTLNK